MLETRHSGVTGWELLSHFSEVSCSSLLQLTKCSNWQRESSSQYQMWPWWMYVLYMYVCVYIYKYIYIYIYLGGLVFMYTLVYIRVYKFHTIRIYHHWRWLIWFYELKKWNKSVRFVRKWNLAFTALRYKLTITHVRKLFWFFWKNFHLL